MNQEQDKDVKTGKKISAFLKAFWDNSSRTQRNNLVIPVCFFTGMIMYLEIVLHLLIYKSMDGRIIYPILFAIPLGFLLALLSGAFNTKVNKILMWVFTVIACLIFNIQLDYYYVFKMYFSFQSLSMAGDAFLEFGSDFIEAIKGNIGGIILLFVPLVILAILMKQYLYCERRKSKEQGALLAGSVLLYVFAMITLLFSGRGDYTPYDLYHHTQVLELCGKQLGIVTMTRIDIRNMFQEEDSLELANFTLAQLNIKNEPSIAPTQVPEITPSPKPAEPNSTPTPTPPPTPTPIDTSPNIMEIDFTALADSEEDETMKTLDQYFASVIPTNKNEYTGMFEGKNLIMITAEGFSPYAVNEEKTPTLYKLTHSGFIFNNFYTALWQTSTSDGEFAAMTGLIPIGTRNMYHTRNNLMPFALGNQFNLLGVASKAYHNHTYTYYDRDQTHTNLGYIFKGKGNGLVLESDVWPGSDLEMINATVDEFINEEQFHVYYLTVSGHMNYTFFGNRMSYKNKALVEDLPYSSDCQAYIACQIELDKALEELIRRLEEAGVADRTVIAMSADHYPYGWEKEKLDELAGHVINPKFEIYRNYFVLWSEGMKENIIVDEPCSSLDILPTLSNLFGLKYDSRLLMGQDIFSDAPPLVILSNRSFVTDKVMYDSETSEVTYLTDEVLPKDYINTLNKVIKNKFKVTESIIDKDYYRYLFPDYIKK